MGRSALNEPRDEISASQHTRIGNLRCIRYFCRRSLLQANASLHCGCSWKLERNLPCPRQRWHTNCERDPEKLKGFDGTYWPTHRSQEPLRQQSCSARCLTIYKEKKFDDRRQPKKCITDVISSKSQNAYRSGIRNLPDKWQCYR